MTRPSASPSCRVLSLVQDPQRKRELQVRDGFPDGRPRLDPAAGLRDAAADAATRGQLHRCLLRDDVRPDHDRVDHPVQHRLASGIDQPVASPACLARRHGADRAGHRRAASARHRRPRHVQGRNAGTDEGFQDDAPHRADGEGLWAVYFGVTLACVFAYRWGGMGWFDAVCHTFSTMGLGGFSTHDASFGHFDSPTLELIAVCSC